MKKILLFIISGTTFLLIFSLLYCGNSLRSVKRGGTMERYVIKSPDRSLPGLAYFTANMTIKGAGERTREDIDRFVEFFGGSLTVDVHPDYISYNIVILNEYVSEMLELLADIVMRPTFPKDELGKLKEKEINRIKLAMSDPEWLSQKAMHKFLFGEGHPYANYDTDLEAINLIIPEYLAWFHSLYYVPNNSILVIAGNVDPEEITKKAEKLFSQWEAREVKELKFPQLKERTQREIVLIDRPHSPQATIIVADYGIERNSPNYIPLRVANQIFGGGASSRLMLRIRERCGYTYGIYSIVTSNINRGPFYVTTAVRNEAVGDALRVLFNEYNKIREEEIPIEELEKSKVYLTGVFSLLMEKVENLAELLSIKLIFNLDKDYWDKYIDRIKGVDLKIAKEIVVKYINPNTPLIIVVGDATQLKHSLTEFGQVSVYNSEFKLVESVKEKKLKEEEIKLPDCALVEIKRESPKQIPSANLTYPNVNFPEVKEYTLENGLKINILSQPRLTISVIKFIVKAGTARDPL